MIVKKPISSVRVGNTISRLTIGKKVPKIVFDFWKNNNMIDDLVKGGFISDESEKQKKDEIKTETKKPNNQEKLFQKEMDSN